MSYTLNLACGCSVYVSCHPVTNIAHSRIVERRGGRCINRKHAVGVRVWLWEILPDSSHDSGVVFNEEDARARGGGGNRPPAMESDGD